MSQITDGTRTMSHPQRLRYSKSDDGRLNFLDIRRILEDLHIPYDYHVARPNEHPLIEIGAWVVRELSLNGAKLFRYHGEPFIASLRDHQSIFEPYPTDSREVDSRFHGQRHAGH